MIKQYYTKLSQYPRLRVVLFVVGLIVILYMVSHLFSSSTLPPAPPSSIATGQVSPNQPSLAPNQQYQALAQQAQQNQVQQAAASGQSFFTGIFNNSNSNATNNNQQQTNTATSQPVDPENFYHRLQSQAGQLAAGATNQLTGRTNYNIGEFNSNYANGNANQPSANSQQASALANQMNQQLQTLSSTWKLPTGSMVVGTEPKVPAPPAGQSGPSTIIVKAGTIYYAVLDVQLDSDTPGTPVLATIVNGPYNGAKLLGSFNRVNDALVVQFSNMSLPSQANTIGITAYAIDGTTAQNALASSVDNHYMLRYGSLFAAAFMQGFGNAYNSNGNNPYCQSGATCNFNSNGPNGYVPATKVAMYQGIGQVGTSLGQQIGSLYNTPPTVILNQGTGMGILFMSDVKI